MHPGRTDRVDSPDEFITEAATIQTLTGPTQLSVGGLVAARCRRTAQRIALLT